MIFELPIFFDRIPKHCFGTRHRWLMNLVRLHNKQSQKAIGTDFRNTLNKGSLLTPERAELERTIQLGSNSSYVPNALCKIKAKE